MMNHLLFSVDRVQCAIPLDQVRIVLQMVLPGPARNPGLNWQGRSISTGRSFRSGQSVPFSKYRIGHLCSLTN